MRRRHTRHNVDDGDAAPVMPLLYSEGTVRSACGGGWMDGWMSMASV